MRCVRARPRGASGSRGSRPNERERTGISNLKVKYHPGHGYSLEVPKSQLERVPEHYERKQTLANVERFTTTELSEVQGKVMGANERAAALERGILEDPRAISGGGSRAHSCLLRTRVADLDALASRSRRSLAARAGFDRKSMPAMKSRFARVGTRSWRRCWGAQGADGFVPNDTELSPSEVQILLLTGPNMSGKSTYLRQVALIVLLAQVGSFVPAESARIGAVDRIFTRVGASDRLARGESTFMVEMRETAEILANASNKSLVILDEIGRGAPAPSTVCRSRGRSPSTCTTRPGWRARTLFATHYHELTDLVHTKSRVRNGHFEAREWKDEVVFLRRLVAGGANRSYGHSGCASRGLARDIDRARKTGTAKPRIERARSARRCRVWPKRTRPRPRAEISSASRLERRHDPRRKRSSPHCEVSIRMRRPLSLHWSCSTALHADCASPERAHDAILHKPCRGSHGACIGDPALRAGCYSGVKRPSGLGETCMRYGPGRIPTTRELLSKLSRPVETEVVRLRRGRKFGAPGPALSRPEWDLGRSRLHRRNFRSRTVFSRTCGSARTPCEIHAW